MNIKRKTQDTIRSAFYACINLHDTWALTNNGEYELKQCVRLAKESRPSMLAKLMVCEHYLQGIADACRVVKADERWKRHDARWLSGIGHAFQRAYLLGVAAGLNARDDAGRGTTEVRRIPVLLASLSAAWEEHRENNRIDRGLDVLIAKSQAG